MKQSVNNLISVMEAANHSKNSAMEAKNHVKHGTSSKSIMSSVLKSIAVLSFSVFFFTSTAFAQQGISVSGKISCDDNPLIGITVREKGTTNTALSNLDGEFQISVANAEAELLFTFPGYNTVEVVVGEQRTLAVEMQRNDEPSEIDMEKLHAQGEDVTKVLGDVQNQLNEIMSEVGTQVSNIRTAALEQATKLRSESNAAADNLLSSAANPVARRAAQPAADRTRAEGETNASRVEEQAETQAENVIQAAQSRADQLKVAAFLQIQRVSEILE